MSLREVRREVDQQIDGIIAPLRQQLREMETLQQDLRRQADTLNDPIRRVKRTISAAQSSGSARPLAASSDDKTRGGEESADKVLAWMRANIAEVNGSGGIRGSLVAERIGMHAGTVRQALRKLEERGAIHLASLDTSGAGRAAPLYKVNET